MLWGKRWWVMRRSQTRSKMNCNIDGHCLANHCWIQAGPCTYKGGWSLSVDGDKIKICSRYVGWSSLSIVFSTSTSSSLLVCWRPSCTTFRLGAGALPFPLLQASIHDVKLNFPQLRKIIIFWRSMARKHSVLYKSTLTAKIFDSR